MKRLVLMRHAKAVLGEPGMDDHARPLNERGRGAAPRMGRWLADRLAADGVAIDLILVSTAMRTRQTMDRIAASISAHPLEHRDELYLAEAPQLLKVVRATKEPAETLLLVGHNSGLEDLARLLAGAGDRALQTNMATKFPTAAVAILTFDVTRWRDIGPRGGTLAAFMTPKGLDAA